MVRLALKAQATNEESFAANQVLLDHLENRAQSPGEPLPTSPQGLGRLREKADSSAPQQAALAQLPTGPPGPPSGSPESIIATLPLLPPPPPEKAQLRQVGGLPGVTYGHVEEAFREIDYDGNGFIGVSELRYLLCTMGERPTDEELDEMIRMLDSEGLGQVSHEQFASMFGETHPVLLEMISQAPTDDAFEARPEEEVEKKSKKKVKNVGPELSENVRNLFVQAASGFISAVHEKKVKADKKPILPKARPVDPLRSRPTSPDSPGSPSMPVHMLRKQNFQMQ